MVDARITNGEAARQLGITQASLARWVRQGKLRPTLITPGGQARWDMDDLRAQLDAMRSDVEEQRRIAEEERIQRAKDGREQ